MGSSLPHLILTGFKLIPAAAETTELSSETKCNGNNSAHPVSWMRAVPLLPNFQDHSP